MKSMGRLLLPNNSPYHAERPGRIGEANVVEELPPSNQQEYPEYPQGVGRPLGETEPPKLSKTKDAIVWPAMRSFAARCQNGRANQIVSLPSIRSRPCRKKLGGCRPN